MIKIKELISDEVDNGMVIKKYSIFENGDLNELEISVLEFNDENSFCIECGRETSIEQINNLFACAFDEFISSKDERNDFELIIPFQISLYQDDIFGGFDTVTRVFKKKNEGVIEVSLLNPWQFDDEEWEKYSPHYIERILKREIDKGIFEDFETGVDKVEDALIVRKRFKKRENLNNSLKSFLKGLGQIQNHLKSKIGTIDWNEEFEKNEAKFSKRLLLPLIRSLGYHNVRYNHGTLEFGKDFIFTEFSKFDEEIHYGMQVKAGDLKGNVKSDLEEIISQIKDSFEMPFYKIGEKSEFYISILIIAISGKFTQNAKIKIRQKLNSGQIGKVFFWDKEKIIELIEKNKNSLQQRLKWQ